ncbi:right-handed parallel beta-helix repeat-containing protein [Limobrevibacterium gyesilva]|uniref:Right-handed parallel beta-helix repeat-containing protein n=1 Tax=Limobrevibacterium gyesilva TaxID=2991712 RepID=A0AA42CJ40_9PROT|nr:right-handed parallel beta-helix repeat-containing protein [Limobrevibacterium gyesilva]MCW3476552.1 right-handed parallel beta-helix repeat-containing protein [Limobrevibacterium gyesilva]
MPTIEELNAAAAVADTDALPVSQNGQARKATRAQLLAGLQPQLALAAGQLLGRNSAGLGGPEPVTLGGNLSLAGGVLSAQTAPLNLPGLPPGAMPATADLVPLGQGGRNVAVPYGQFMAGIGGLGGIDLSGVSATAAGTPFARRLADLLADAAPVEAFGAKGDGVTDDSAALAAAVASGKPVRLGPKTYVVNGQWTIARPGTVLLGVPGLSVLKRARQAGNGAWIAVQADEFRADGVIFDANRADVAVESWGVLLTGLCQVSDLHRCAFVNAAGATLGSGLVIQASDPAPCRHVVRDCAFAGNAAHGIWVQACAGVQVVDCRAHDNAQYGINVDFNDAGFGQKARLVQVLGNRCWNNARGIAVGNYNATNTQPAVWGNANPDAIAVLVSGNVCHDNSIYGIAASGQALVVQGNLLSDNGTGAAGGAGLLANTSGSRVAGNMVVGGATYGIDCGGSVKADVSGNHVAGAVFGINCGGGSCVRVDANTIQDCTGWAISVNNVETDGLGVNFGIACSNLAITGNWIGLPSAGAGGVLLRDGPQNVLVARNHFVGPGDAGNCLCADTDSVIVEGNRFNFTARFVCNPAPAGGLQQVVFPDIADGIMITYAPAGVQAMVSSHQAQAAGKLSFVRVNAGGSGYSHASVAIGGAGSGAVAEAVISNGAVIGVVVTASGGGYGPVGSTVPVAISGDGAGALATGYAGPPLPEERRLLVRCNTDVRFARAGSVPLQENWTFTDLAVPADGDVEWTATWGMWRAGRFAPFAYLGADGAGGAILRSADNGDVALRPNGAGHVRLSSDTEASGCIAGIGRGSPQGVVAAPPGSDYRNLDGGAGSTYWVKQTGTGSTGWVAIA